MRYRPAHVLAATIVALLAAVAGYTVYWFVAVAVLRDGIEAWAAARRAEGYTVGYDALAVSGFPARLAVEIAAPRVGRSDEHFAWTWSADRLAAGVRPWAFDEITVTLSGTHRVRYRRDGGEERAITADIEHGVARVHLAAGAARRVAVAMTGVVVATPRGTLRIARLDAAGDGETESSLRINVDVQGVTLPPGSGGVLGSEISAAAAEASVAGAAPEALSRAALLAWSRGGGTVELEALSIRWDGLGLHAAGTLALDDRLRPQAALTAEITGYAAVLEALAQAGAMKPSDAALATTFLNLMAKTGADGERLLSVPLTAQDGTLFVGPLPLVKLAPVLPE
ncbi:MAG: DUF2125 domain-containing protein [Proteobacteria bacterium]|nr:DUF2125 domain-containing protein [Pseudomonadota bacterium]